MVGLLYEGNGARHIVNYPEAQDLILHSSLQSSLVRANLKGLALWGLIFLKLNHIPGLRDKIGWDPGILLYFSWKEINDKKNFYAFKFFQ